jgi:hypothetical protein
MAVMSAGSLINLRTKTARATPYISILQPATLLTAQTNGAFARGTRTFLYNTGTGTAGQFATIQAGQTIWFYTDIGIQRSRIKSITGDEVSGSFEIDENDICGSAGNVPDNTIIEIYHVWEIQPIPPVIRSQVFYKFYSISYTDQNEEPTPVAIAGPHRAFYASPGTISNTQIATGPDDGYILIAFLNSTTSVRMGFSGGTNIDTWIRFISPVDIPLGATITSATVDLTAFAANTGTIDVNIQGELALDPIAPIDTTDYNSRVRTVATVNWTFGTAWVVDTVYATPDISTIIQEIVDLGGISAGDAIQLFINNNGGTAVRSFYAYEGDVAKSAGLNVTFTDATFTLDATPSYAIANGAAISTYAWTCVKNGGGTVGITIANAAAASTTITIENAGQYWLRLIVTDDNGKTQSTYRAIFVYDDDNPPYKDFAVQSLTGDWNTNGYRGTLNITGADTLADIPDRTLCLIWYENVFDATEGYVDLWDVNADNIIVEGYIRQDTDTDTFSDGTGSASFEFTTPDAVLDSIWELGSVSLNARATVAKWWHYASWMTTGRAIHHLIKYQSYGVLQLWDVYGLTDDSRGVLNTDFTEQSLLQQANSLAYGRGIYAKMMCNRLGQLYLVKDSQILNMAGRAALDTVMTILEADISGIVTLVRQPEETTAFAELNGFSFNGTTSTPFISVLPGYRESSVTYILPELRGGGSLSVGNQILSSQTDSNERIGRVLAQANNNPRELRFTTPSNYIGAFDIIPSIGWYSWGISDADLKRNTELFERLLICRNIAYTFDHAAGIISTSVVFEPEASGPDGVQGNYPLGYPTPALPTPGWIPPNICTTLTLGTPVTFETGSTNYTAIAALSSTDFIVCYSDFGNGSIGTACIIQVSGTTVTAGTPVTFATGSTLYISVAMLSTTKVIVTYRDNGVGPNYGQACILDISGTTITPGAAATFSAVSQFGSTGVITLTSIKALVTYSTSTQAEGCVLDVSGSTITPNTAVVIDNTGVFVSTAVEMLDSSTAICVIGDGGTKLFAKILSSITTTFTVEGGGINIDAVGTFDSRGFNYVKLVEANKLIVVYQTGNAYSAPEEYRIKAVVLTISGTTITAGTSVFVSEKTYGYDSTAGVIPITDTCCVCCYDQLQYGGLVPLNISDATIMVQDIITFGTNDVTSGFFEGAVAKISSTKVLLCYGDSGDSNQGKAVVVSVS